MRIASKINAALFAAFAGGTLATFFVLQSAIQPRFNDIERAGAQMNHKRVTDAFDAFTEKLKTATQDYAFWDESYKFLQGEGVDDFIASNLTPEFKAVENLGVNALIFLRKDGSVAWGSAYDLESKEPMEGTLKEIAHFSRSHPYIGNSSPEAKRGVITTSKGLMLVAIAPVLKSDGSGEPVGKVITAKLLDVEAAKALTGVDFTLEPLPRAAEYGDLDTGTKFVTLQDHIQTSSLLKNLVGRPLAVVQVNSPRDVSQMGTLAIHSAMKMMILAGLLALAVLWAYLRNAVVARIETLAAHFTTAGTSGTIKPTKVAGNDELSVLAKNFNGMAEEVNVLRDGLADSAFMSGLSEWAAGTLHNVRNGLAPIGANTWQITQLFDRTWLNNVDTALKQHADETTDPERRSKLNSYLVSSAAKFLASAHRTSEFTEKIQSASTAILDMASEFERYAHRDTVLEPIDLGPLVASVATASTERPDGKVDLVLPKSSNMITSNAVILRQVLSNVFVNAMEAIEGQERPGRIAVSISDALDHSGFTRLTISDNGKGITGDRLKEIFHRGRTSKIDRPGGLGLHWCANAINVLGGTITAQSSGIGLGTSIIIDLPNKISDREAA